MAVPAPNPYPECSRCRKLEARVLELEIQLRDLQERLKPPPAKRPAPTKTPTGKTRGAQPGHKPHLKKLLPPEQVAATITHVLTCCERCDQPLSPLAGPNDPPPMVH